MPLETFTGADVPSLLQTAQQVLGADAVVLAVRRRSGRGAQAFELTAADPETAARATRPRPVHPPAPAPEGPPASPFVSTMPVGAPPSRAHPVSVSRFRRNRLARREGFAEVMAFVGPTGSGKTTAIAKLANHPRAFGGRRVGLLGLDTWRIGAVEQLEQIAELSRTPLAIAWDVSDLPRALRKLAGCDAVLVDTAGRGPREADDLEGIARLLEALRPSEVHLVLPAGMQPALSRRTAERLQPLRPTHLLPSKLDEAPDDRALLRLASERFLPVRWLSDGQHIPRDLQFATTPFPSAAAGAWELREAA